ncbi:MAG: tRNA lysidine(34) synthetase TilS [Methylophilaceae bacterium]|nr:MAG: tRNA lysidine(34) synthetase TilS [Methylophilaceae bacterium]
MVSSKKLPANNVQDNESCTLLSQLKLFLTSFFKQHQLVHPTLLVAYSGGLDSTVLLHAMHQLQSELTFALTAMHVHHGLSFNADDWANFCEKNCNHLGIPLQQCQVRIDQDSGLGLEAAARNARYQALQTTNADFICLAHHQDDQAETLLLQLARGSGVKGLAGMAQIDEKRRLVRPLLHASRHALALYAKAHQLQWIDDESNADTSFNRNFIRHELLPIFSKRYTSITKTLARSASHMAEANQLLDELALLDASTVLDKQYKTVRIASLIKLSQARKNNVIRFWLNQNNVELPNASLLGQILQQLTTEKADAAIKIKVAEKLYVMRYQGLAYLVIEQNALAPINLLWQGEEIVMLPNLSRLYFTVQKGKGFAYQRGGSDIKLRIKNREGGEYFKPTLGRPRRHLKTVMQTSQIPPWQRAQLPLIFMDETLVIIPNIGCDAEMEAQSHEAGLIVRWEPATH